MSCIGYLTRSRANVARRFLHHPSVGHFDRSDDGDSKRKNASPSLQRSNSFSSQARFQNSSKIGLLRSPAKYFGASFYRSLSTGNRDSGHSDIADFLSGNAGEAIASSAPAAVVNEVAVAAADSFYPVYLVQHFIDAVHCYTGFNWWSSIVIAALINRGVILLPINLYLANVRLLARTNMGMVKEKFYRAIRLLNEPKGKDVHKEELEKITNEAHDLLFLPTMMYIIKAPVHVCFFLGISNMAEKVPSFKTGGAYWFLDLSTPDSLFIFPFLTSLLLSFPYKVRDMVDIHVKSKFLNAVALTLAPLIIYFTTFIPKVVLLYFSVLELYLLRKHGPIT